jgi:sugar O-acyltransferase (sialic acid O-acetyltransferase NeuD family)
MMEKIVILGISGHAKVIIDIVEQEGRYKVAGLVDRFCRDGVRILSYPVIGQDEDLPLLLKQYTISGVIVAIGDNFLRATVAARVAEACPGLRFVSTVHPRAYVAREVRIGAGSVVMAGVSVNPSCVIGNHCILNTNASLDHDSCMADFSSIAPGVITGGGCQIGEYSAVGIGAVMIHNITIGDHTIIGAGATVVKDIESFAVAYGSPAKIIRNRKPGEQYL